MKEELAAPGRSGTPWGDPACEKRRESMRSATKPARPPLGDEIAYKAMAGDAPRLRLRELGVPVTIHFAIPQFRAIAVNEVLRVRGVPGLSETTFYRP